MAKTDLTAQRLREVLDFDSETGVFTWKKCTRRRPELVGTIAGSSSGSQYRRIYVDAKGHYEHRLAWLYVHGEWPTGEIDHINGNKADNRIANLRDVSRSLNLHNVHNARLPNKHGHVGVRWNSVKRKWEARIQVDGKAQRLGAFVTPEEAGAAYAAAKQKFLPDRNT